MLRSPASTGLLFVILAIRSEIQSGYYNKFGLMRKMWAKASVISKISSLLRFDLEPNYGTNTP